MGWTFTTRSKYETSREFFAKEFSCCNIIDISSKANITYLVLENKKQLGERFAVVCLTRWRRNDTFNFGYKDISEDMGPYETECPVRLLNLLTATESSYAKEWRERCHQNAKHQKSKPVLRNGVKIKLAHPLKFTDKTEHDTFQVVKDGRKTRFIGENGRMYRITGLKRYDFSLIVP